jgi:AraC-like DNA-binding protein
MVDSFKGSLYPARLPTFHRVPAPESVRNLVQWFWIPEWDIAPGHTSRQHVIAFPASNLVVQQDLVEFAGPTTRRSHRDLTGRGWAVGALLRPALVPHFTDDPESLRDAQLPLPLADLHASVLAAVSGTDPAERRQRAVEAFTGWLVAEDPEVSEEGLLANAMMDLIGSSAEVTRLEDAAARLFVSPRTLQRVAKKYIGLSPSALIRRRRLQEAADRSRTDPAADLAAIAAELGYTDHAHLTNDFQRTLGFTPSTYRRRVSIGPTTSDLALPGGRMPHIVDFKNVSTAGLESSPVADAAAGLRANEARYFSTKYNHVFTVSPASEVPEVVDRVSRILREERDIVIGSRPMEATDFEVDGLRMSYVFYESGLSINVMYSIEDGGKRAVGFKLADGMDVPEELAERFKFARQKSKLAGTIRGSYFVIKGEY